MTCEACGGELHRDVAELELGRGRTAVAQAGWYCWACGSARFSAADLYQAERQLQLAENAESPRIVAVVTAAKAA